METIEEPISMEKQILQKSPKVHAWLTSETEFWTGFSIIFALFLFVLWSVYFGFDLVSWVFIVVLYNFGILVAIRKPDYQSVSQEVNDTHSITFIRPGIAWKRITDSLIGLAILSSILVYMFSNALPNNPEFVSIVYEITLIFHIFIVPIIPILSQIKSLPILKSKISFVYDDTRIIKIIPELHPLDYQLSIESMLSELEVEQS